VWHWVCAWCGYINRAFRRLLAVAVRAVLPQLAVNIPNRRLKNTAFFVVYGWEWVVLRVVAHMAGLDMTWYLDIWRVYGKIYT